MPGVMYAYPLGHDGVAVADGDFIGCCCARTRALEGRCHMFHAVPFLAEAGWRVVFHGEERK